jgi:hypothetical protein
LLGFNVWTYMGHWTSTVARECLKVGPVQTSVPTLPLPASGHGPPCRFCSCSSCMLCSTPSNRTEPNQTGTSPFWPDVAHNWFTNTLSANYVARRADLVVGTYHGHVTCAVRLQPLSSSSRRRSPRAMSTNGTRAWPTSTVCPELVRALILEGHSVQFGVRRQW